MQLFELQMEWKRGLALQNELKGSRADEVTHFRVSWSVLLHGTHSTAQKRRVGAT